MKKTILLTLFLALVSLLGFSQVTCPTGVTTLNWTIVRPVVADQIVGEASVCDPDANQTETWAITDATGYWKITTIAGTTPGWPICQVKVANAAAINASVATSWSMTITVTDNGTPVLNTSATVNLNDLNHPPVMGNQTFTVNENVPNGTVIGTVVATDPDANQTKTFTIVSGNTGGAFSLNSTTGALTVSNATLLNYEISPSFVLVVKVQDNGTGALSTQATITVNLNNVNEARNFYFSTSNGDDSRTSTQAQNPATPWKTIAKANSFSASYLAGDSILFKRGDTFTGPIHITKSGSIVSPIVVSAYGTGADPIISGFTTVSGWTNEGSGIYSKALSFDDYLGWHNYYGTNLVTVDGVNTPMGRYPNSGYLTYESCTYWSITDNQLSGTPNWTGAEAVVRKHNTGWMTDRSVITNHVGSTLTLTAPQGTPWGVIPGFGYYIQNDIRTLDTLGEWYFNSSTSTLYMYFGAVDPATKTVKMATTDVLVYSEDKICQTYDNLTLSGAYLSGVYFDGTTAGNNVIQNCAIEYSAMNGIWTSPYSSDKCITINGNTISQINGTGIQGKGARTTCTITNNTLSNIGMIQGACSVIPDENWGDGIAVQGLNSLVEYNSVTNCGHSGIRFQHGKNIAVQYNFVNGFGYTRTDAGGIYCWNDGDTTLVGQKIKNNIVLGNNSFTSAQLGIAGASCNFLWGIYLDQYDITTGVEVSGNTVQGCSTGGFFFFEGLNATITNNTCYDNGYGIGIYYTLKGLNFNNNFFISKTATQPCLCIKSSSTDLGYGVSDYNYYARPINDNLTIQTVINDDQATNRTLAGWQTLMGQDAHSHKSLIAITDTSSFRFEYNATKINKTIPLNTTYLGIDSTVYSTSITLLPYASAVLIKKNSTGSNQSPVLLNQSFQINENSSNGTTVGTVIASDPDAGQTLTYSILSGNTNGAFAINSSSGVLTVANTAALNYETTPTFALIVKVQDNGSPSLSSQATVTVNLINVNEPPVMVNQTFSIPENSANGTSVGTVIASDPDAGQTLSYSILSGNTSGAFTIGATTGTILVANASALNYEVTPSFALVVKVQDNGTPSQNSQATITVNLTNVNEAPVIYAQ